VERRIAVKGASGSGKTTVAARLAERLGVPHIELDALFHGPGWTESPTEDFRRRVAEATAGDGWVVDGGYEGKLGVALPAGTELVVWLDLPLHVIVPRLIRRTRTRIRDGTELWASGNREDWEEALFGWNSLVVYAVRAHFRLRRDLPGQCRELDVPLVRIRTPTEAERWLEAPRRRASPGAAHRLGR
jgi:adenylate kinase family enzyme